MGSKVENEDRPSVMEKHEIVPTAAFTKGTAEHKKTHRACGSFSSDRHAPDALGMSASLRSLPKFGTAANRRGVPFAVIPESIRALNIQEHPAASNPIATAPPTQPPFWSLFPTTPHASLAPRHS